MINLLSIFVEIFGCVTSNGFGIQIVLYHRKDKPHQNDEACRLVVESEYQAVNDYSLLGEPFDQGLEHWQLIFEIWSHSSWRIMSILILRITCSLIRHNWLIM